MKKIFIALIFCIFACCVNKAFAYENGTYKVIKVIDGDTLFLDFNNDGKYQQEEKVRINGIDTFEVKPSVFLEWQMKEFNLTQSEALGLGYFGKEFAKKNLLNKYVKAKYSGDTKLCDMGRQLMSISYDNGKNYEQEVLKDGLATVYKKSNLAPELYKYENLDKIKANIKKTHWLNLVLLNKKNNTYHKVNCEYGLMASNVELIQKPLFLTYKPASCCFKNGISPLNSVKKSIKNLYEPCVQIFFVDPKKYSSPQNICKNEACTSLLNAINNATSSIDFAIYGIGSQDAIFNAIVAAQKRGVKVHGVVDMNIQNQNPYPDTWRLIDTLKTVKTDYMDMDFSPQKEDYIQTIRYNLNGKIVEASFVNKGIKNYAESIMHDKYFIIDKTYVYTGSMNISASCNTYNSNVSVLIKSPKLAEYYLNDFNQMYENGKFHQDKTKILQSNSITLEDGTLVQSFVLPESSNVYYEISKEIKNAKKYIYVPMFFFTHKRYPQDLIDAHNRGVDVRVIVDATSARTGYSKHEILRLAGIPVKVENWGGKMHMKSLIIDDKYVLIGSMNFTSGAQYTNDENTLLIKNKNIAKKFKRHFLYLWNTIPDKWLTGNPIPEGEDSPGSCSDGIDNNHNGLIDMDDPCCNPALKNTPTLRIIQEGPIED